MTGIERQLRDAMRAHDADAPRAADFQSAPPRRSRVPAVLGAVLVAATVAVGAAILASRPSPAPDDTANPAATGALSSAPQAPPQPGDCPGRIADPSAPASWVPGDSDGPADALVPAGVPDAVTVCGYLGSPDRDGATAIAGELALVTADLAVVPPGDIDTRACLLYLAQTDADNYLVRLDYPDRTVWVAAPGDHCKGATNGRFSTGTNLRADAAQAFRYGRWDTDPVARARCDEEPDPAAPATLGADAATITVCVARDGTQRAYRYDQPDFPTKRYNDLAARSDPGTTCATSPAASTFEVTVVLAYADGPDAVVRGTPSCLHGPGGVTLVDRAAAEVVEGLTFFFVERVRP